MVGRIRLLARMFTKIIKKIKIVLLSVSMPDGVELGPGCTRVASLIVNAWLQARP
jgi:hypothetical protein